MYLQILKIILWPKNHNFMPHQVDFNVGEVNIISGVSRTGKSAIIPIIDYCLGSDKCNIPVNTIRNTCEWFGLLIDTKYGQKLLARKEPGVQKSTSEMYLLEGPVIDIPAVISAKNSTSETVKKMLDEIAGLTNLDFDSERTDSGFKGRPSFRDMTAFIFQPQNIIANADVFFYKADTYEHREKLRNIFPYVLDAITPQIMAKLHELSSLNRELTQKTREYESVKTVSERWVAEIRSRVSEAKEYGLGKKSISSNASREDLLEYLEEIINNPLIYDNTTEGTISEAIGELLKLRKEESHVSTELLGLRKRYEEMSSLKELSVDYTDSLGLQKERLKISNWLQTCVDENQKCPICGNKFIESISELKQLSTILKEVDDEIKGFKNIPPAFDREYERVKSDLRISTEKLSGIKIRISNLEKLSKEVETKSYDSARISRFVGNLEEAFKYYSTIGDNSILRDEINSLKFRIQEINSQVSQPEIKAKINRILKIISNYVGILLPKLDNERPADPIEFVINDLSIKVIGNDREDYLWEVGSASNWLSYHIAVLLAFHQYFNSLQHSPVPSFIVFDQPSQAYFPHKTQYSEKEADEFRLKDEDVIAVRKIFEVIASIVKSMNKSLQVIILDHAAEDVWGDLGINVVEEWRNNRRLIPAEWYQ